MLVAIFATTLHLFDLYIHSLYIYLPLCVNLLIARRVITIDTPCYNLVVIKLIVHRKLRSEPMVAYYQHPSSIHFVSSSLI